MPEQTPASPPPSTPAAPRPLGKASDLMRELAADPKAGTPPPPPGRAPGAASGAGGSSGAPGAAAAGSEGGASGSSDGSDPEVADRLARIAREQRRLEKSKQSWKAEQEAWRAEQATKLASAASWERLQEARTTKGRMAALDAIFDAGEIEADLYQELTERVYGKGDGATGLTRADADKLVEAKLAAARKADEDAAKKAADDAEQARATKATESETGYLAYVNVGYDPAKYPVLASILAELPDAVSGRDILAYAKSYHAEHGEAPSAEDVLGHFEEKLKKKFQPAAIEEPQAGARVPPTVTRDWNADSRPKDPGKKMSLADSLAEAKRQAGIRVS